MKELRLYSHDEVRDLGALDKGMAPAGLLRIPGIGYLDPNPRALYVVESFFGKSQEDGRTSSCGLFLGLAFEPGEEVDTLFKTLNTRDIGRLIDDYGIWETKELEGKRVFAYAGDNIIAGAISAEDIGLATHSRRVAVS